MIKALGIKARDENSVSDYLVDLFILSVSKNVTYIYREHCSIRR
jgi:hypothetical protein